MYLKALTKVGADKTTVTESRPNECVRIRLDFIRPFAGTNCAQFRFKAEGHATTVSGTMQGKSFSAKVIGRFVSMDRRIGRNFELGLADLKRQTEVAQVVLSDVACFEASRRLSS